MKTVAAGIFVLAGLGSPGHAAADACVSANTSDDIDTVTVDGDTVKLCLGVGNGRGCWSVGLTDGMYTPAALTAAPATQPVADPAGPTGEAKGDGVDVCLKPGQCKHVAVKLGKHEELGAVFPSPDGAWLAVLASQSDDTHGHLRLYDVASARLTGSVGAWSLPRIGKVFMHGVSWVGNDLVQVLASYGGSTEAGRLVDVHGKLISDRPSLVMEGPRQLSDGRWALDAYNGEELTLVDAKHHVQHVDLADLPPGGAFSPIAAIVPAPPARLVLVLGAGVPDFLGDVVVIDEKTGKHKRWKAPRCH
jgi:hypothetical protein